MKCSLNGKLVILLIHIIYLYNFSDNNEDNKVATKIICYTRSTPTIHELPVVYPSTSLSEFQSLDDIKNFIFEKV